MCPRSERRSSQQHPHFLNWSFGSCGDPFSRAAQRRNDPNQSILSPTATIWLAVGRNSTVSRVHCRMKLFLYDRFRPPRPPTCLHVITSWIVSRRSVRSLIVHGGACVRCTLGQYHTVRHGLRSFCFCFRGTEQLRTHRRRSIKKKITNL